MSFMKDFKAFAMKGSVLDLAVGVIIGGAFGKIVTSMVEDIIMPLVGTVSKTGELFANKYIVLSGDVNVDHKSLEEARKAGANVFAYGHFLQSVVDFFIIAFCIFVAIRFIGKLHRKEEEVKAIEPLGPSSTDKLLTEIRDLLKEQQK